jgi:hypothetical protein
MASPFVSDAPGYVSADRLTLRAMLHATRARALLAAAVLAAPSQAPAGLDNVLQQAEGQRAAYVATFRNVTATETRVTEVFDDRGRVEKQRTLVSNFLVYQSRFDPAVLSEYRLPIAVDGKPTGKPEQDAIKLFGRLARARSTAEELEVLKEQNVSHGLRFVLWGVTLHPLGAVRADLRGRFEFSLQGTESLDGREVTILDYREKTPRRVEWRLLSQFAEPRILSRGRAWLDASDHGLRRWVHETVVSDKTLPEPGAVLRSEREYTSSAFGILTPRRVVSEFYRKSGRKNGPQSLRLAVRLTDTYSDFRRFDVSTVSDIRLPDTKEQ